VITGLSIAVGLLGFIVVFALVIYFCQRKKPT
jgi:hypothetical protein